MANDLDTVDNYDLEVKEAQPALKKPSMYQVVLLNDDFTPMEFVVEVLTKFFHMSKEQATRIMMHVHTRGKGVCGVYTKDVAQTRKLQINEYSKTNRHPLQSDIEKI